MDEKEIEITNKLQELEASLSQERKLPPLATDQARTELLGCALASDQDKLLLKSDLQCLFGLMLISVGVLMVFNHARVGSGMMTIFGFNSSGAGLPLLILLCGLGFIFYDYKNRIGWLLSVIGIALVLFILLSQLVIYFPHLTLLGFIFMFLPLAAGIAITAKGIRLRKQIERKVNNQ
ncbi:MAG: hypothetical protein K2W82_07500 [Candidatus Obscuribacterales bacterium]|nr:hypothetical protein [Candidatus Obscuribacterales bacterium]